MLFRHHAGAAARNGDRHIAPLRYGAPCAFGHDARGLPQLPYTGWLVSEWRELAQDPLRDSMVCYALPAQQLDDLLSAQELVDITP